MKITFDVFAFAGHNQSSGVACGCFWFRGN